MRRRQLRLEVDGVRLVGDRGGDVAVTHHRVEDIELAAARVGVSLAQERVEVRRTLGQARQEGGLSEIQPAGGRSEIGLCRRLHAKGLVAVEDGVEVHLQDLVLRVLPLQLEREDQLARLAVEAAAAGAGVQQVIFDQLLGDRAAALCRFLVQDVVHPGGEHPDRVDRPVVVKVLVLDGDGGVSEVPGHLVQRDHGAALLVALLEQRHAIAGVDPGGLRQALRVEVVEAGEFAGIGVEEGAGPDQHRQQAGRRQQQDPAKPVWPAAMAALRRACRDAGRGKAPRAASPAPGRRVSHWPPGKRGHWAQGYPARGREIGRPAELKLDSEARLHAQ